MPDTTIAVPADLLAAIVDSLYRLGCQFGCCEGETLEPVDMVTCHRCATLARVRALGGGS